MPRIAAGLLACLVAAWSWAVTGRQAAIAATVPEGRAVAITFDDLPVISVTPLDAAGRSAITRKLLESLERRKAPATGFVNEYGLHGYAREPGPAPDPDGVALLRSWLRSGHELGNHGFAHADLHSSTVEQYTADILRGEAVIGPLMRAHGKRLRYFRHPYLHTGRDLDTRAKIERFLQERGCRPAPVTVDNEDYVFAAAYSRAGARGDAVLMRRVAAEYAAYTELSLQYSERLARSLFGREISHVLLLHANALNADHFDTLAEMMRGRGYRFITLDEALDDPAYRSPERYVGPVSINWLGRWAITRGARTEENVLDDFPEVPKWVEAAAAP